MSLKRKYLMGVAMIVASLGLLVLAWSKFFHPVAPPDLKTTDSKNVANYLASDAFGKLGNEQKQSYMDTLRKTRPDLAGPAPQGLTGEQQKRIRQNLDPVFRARMDRDIDEYFKLPAGERKAYLDQRIDRMQASRRTGGGPNGPPPFGPPPGGRGGPPPRPNPEMMRRMVENTPPKQRARMIQFMDAMRKRMKERGMEGPP